MKDELSQKAGVGVDELHRATSPKAKAYDISIAHRVVVAEAREVCLQEILGFTRSELIMPEASGLLSEDLLKEHTLLLDALSPMPLY